MCIGGCRILAQGELTADENHLLAQEIRIILFTFMMLVCFSFSLVYVCACARVLYMRVQVCIRRPKQNVLNLPQSLSTLLFSKDGARLAGPPASFWGVPVPQCWCLRYTQPCHLFIYIGAKNSNSTPQCLHDKHSYPLSHHSSSCNCQFFMALQIINK